MLSKIVDKVGMSVLSVESTPQVFARTIEDSYRKLSVNSVFNPESSRIITYEGLGDYRLIISEVISDQRSSKYHMMIEKDGKIGQNPFIMKIEDLVDGKQSISFSDSFINNRHPLFQYINDNGFVDLTKVKYRLHDNQRKCSWGCRFGNCTKSVFDAFTDGTAGNAVVGLLCVAFGPECAGSVGVVCAIAATEGYFREPI